MRYDFFIKEHWGSYRDLIELSVRDLTEIKISIDSKKQEEVLSQYE